MLPLKNRFANYLVVSADGGCDDYGVNPWIAYYSPVILFIAQPWIHPAHIFQSLLVEIHHRIYFALRQTAKGANMVRAPVSAANYSDLDHRSSPPKLPIFARGYFRLLALHSIVAGWLPNCRSLP